jgi:hypothetical protein
MSPAIYTAGRRDGSAPRTAVITAQQGVSNDAAAMPITRPSSPSRVELMTVKGRIPKHRGGRHRKNSAVLKPLLEAIRACLTATGFSSRAPSISLYFRHQALFDPRGPFHAGYRRAAAAGDPPFQ